MAEQGWGRTAPDAVRAPAIRSQQLEALHRLGGELGAGLGPSSPSPTLTTRPTWPVLLPSPGLKDCLLAAICVMHVAGGEVYQHLWFRSMLLVAATPHGNEPFISWCWVFAVVCMTLLPDL